jgi:hypothetical protein
MSSFRTDRRVGLIVVGLLLAGTAVPRGENGISAVFEDAQLDAVVARLATISNTSISLEGPLTGQRVSLVLDQATLAESLDKAFADQNSVIVWRNDGGVTILMLGPGEALPKAGGGSVPDSIPTPLGMLPNQPEVLAIMDQPGVTAADLAFDRSLLPPVDADAVGVIPPEAGAEHGVSLGEFRSLLSHSGNVATADMEILPPENGMKRGITSAEFEALQPQQRNVSAAEIEVLSPEDTGDKALTLAELQRLFQTDRAPESMGSELTSD